MKKAEHDITIERVRLPLALEENNLVEFPLCLLADEVPDGRKTLIFNDTISDAANKCDVHRNVIVTAGDNFGLPNWWDQDVLLALMVHTFQASRFVDRRVAFTLYGLLQLLDLKDDGRNIKRLKLSLDRWCALTIKYENAWRNHDRWTTKTFHMLDNVDLTRGRDYDPDEEQVFKWNDVVMESIGNKYTKPFDWEFYRGLASPTAKRLYRFLDKRFHQRRRWDFEGVQVAVNKLGLLRGQNAWRYKCRINEGAAELVEKGFLKQPRFEKEGTGRFRVFFEAEVKAKTRRGTSRRQQCGLELELLNRGVVNAAEIVRQQPEAKIRQQIGNYDHRRKSGEEIGPGWLGAALVRESGFGFRKDYVSSEAQEAKRLADADKSCRQNQLRIRREEAQRAKEERLRKRLDGKLAEFSKDALVRMEQEAVSLSGRLEQSRYFEYRKTGDRKFEMIRRAILERYLFPEG